MFLVAIWRKKYCVPVLTTKPAIKKSALARHPSAVDQIQLKRISISPTPHHIKPAQQSSHALGTAGFQSTRCSTI
jgi:hypothetical protein